MFVSTLFRSFVVKEEQEATLNTKLQNIATITTGYYGQAEPEADLVCLQARNFDDNGSLVEVLYPELKATFKTKKHLLKDGDVLFAAKGSRSFATCYRLKDYPTAVASTTFFIIRLFENATKNVIPEYLVWVLNHASTKQKIIQTSSGSAVNSLSKSFLTELEIEVPTIETQKRIVTISNLLLKKVCYKKNLFFKGNSHTNATY
ncbi:MAG: restriction endonuclease subunit S [Bacteroidetes bacterium]|nr:restriction endonuclease subunit S [Bacteroidota bacterium]